MDEFDYGLGAPADATAVAAEAARGAEEGVRASAPPGSNPGLRGIPPPGMEYNPAIFAGLRVSDEVRVPWTCRGADMGNARYRARNAQVAVAFVPT